MPVDDKTWVGSLAEAVVTAKLAENKFHVFQQISGKAPFDLVAYRDGKLYRISVKGCAGNVSKARGSFIVYLERKSNNRTCSKRQPFRCADCDVLAVYIHTLRKIWFIPAARVGSRANLSLRTVATKNVTCGEQFLLSEYEGIPWM